MTGSRLFGRVLIEGALDEGRFVGLGGIEVGLYDRKVSNPTSADAIVATQTGKDGSFSVLVPASKTRRSGEYAVRASLNGEYLAQRPAVWTPDEDPSMGVSVWARTGRRWNPVAANQQWVSGRVTQENGEPLWVDEPTEGIRVELRVIAPTTPEAPTWTASAGVRVPVRDDGTFELIATLPPSTVAARLRVLRGPPTGEGTILVETSDFPQAGGLQEVRITCPAGAEQTPPEWNRVPAPLQAKVDAYFAGDPSAEYDATVVRRLAREFDVPQRGVEALLFARQANRRLEAQANVSLMGLSVEVLYGLRRAGLRPQDAAAPQRAQGALVQLLRIALRRRYIAGSLAVIRSAMIADLKAIYAAQWAQVQSADLSATLGSHAGLSAADIAKVAGHVADTALSEDESQSVWDRIQGDVTLGAAVASKVRLRSRARQIVGDLPFGALLNSRTDEAELSSITLEELPAPTYTPQQAYGILAKVAARWPTAAFGSQALVLASTQAEEDAAAFVRDAAADGFDIRSSDVSDFITSPHLPANESLREAALRKVRIWRALAPIVPDAMAAHVVFALADLEIDGDAFAGRSPMNLARLPQAQVHAALELKLSVQLGAPMAALLVERGIGPAVTQAAQAAAHQVAVAGWVGPTTANTCACASCVNQLSPAAYLVDLLDFTRRVQRSGTTGPRSVFAWLSEPAVRPEIAGIELTCANQDTEVPTIDLVNELLERDVALLSGRPDASVPARTTGTASDRRVAPEASPSVAGTPSTVRGVAGVSLASAATQGISLPFDAARFVTRTLLADRGMSLARLGELALPLGNASTPEQRLAVALEQLGLEAASAGSLTAGDGSDTSPRWGVAPAAVGTVTDRLEKFLVISGLTAAEAEQLCNCLTVDPYLRLGWRPDAGSTTSACESNEWGLTLDGRLQINFELVSSNWSTSVRGWLWRASGPWDLSTVTSVVAPTGVGTYALVVTVSGALAYRSPGDVLATDVEIGRIEVPAAAAVPVRRTASPPAKMLVRIDRLIRVARATGMSLAQADRVLHALSGGAATTDGGWGATGVGVLDEAGIGRLARIDGLSKGLGVPSDRVVGWLYGVSTRAPLDAHGMDVNEFDATFPPTLAGATPAGLTLASHRRELAGPVAWEDIGRHVQSALGLNDSFVLNRWAPKVPSLSWTSVTGLSELNRLVRHAQLASALHLSPSALWDLLDGVFESHWSVSWSIDDLELVFRAARLMKDLALDEGMMAWLLGDQARPDATPAVAAAEGRRVATAGIWTSTATEREVFDEHATDAAIDAVGPSLAAELAGVYGVSNATAFALVKYWAGKDHALVTADSPNASEPEGLGKLARTLELQRLVPCPAPDVWAGAIEDRVALQAYLMAANLDRQLPSSPAPETGTALSTFEIFSAPSEQRDVARVKAQLVSRVNPTGAAGALLTATELDAALAAFGLASAAYVTDRWLDFLVAVGRVSELMHLASGVGGHWPDLLSLGDLQQPSGTLLSLTLSSLHVGLSAQGWRDLAERVQQALRPRWRRSLIEWLARYDVGSRSAAALQARLLTDVLVDPGQTTTRILFATQAVQTALQRVQLRLDNRFVLEPAEREQWTWMKRYRLWEANRRIALAPHRWLDPELFGDRSQPFDRFMGALGQSDLSEASIEHAVVAYWNDLSEIATLQPIGHYEEHVCQHDAIAGTSGLPRVKATRLHVVARAASSPARHYYRYRREDGTWTPWESVGASIGLPHVSIAVEHGRVILAWLTVVSGTDTNPITSGRQDNARAPKSNIVSDAFGTEDASPVYGVRLDWIERRGSTWLDAKSSSVLKYRPRSVWRVPADWLALTRRDWDGPLKFDVYLRVFHRDHDVVRDENHEVMGGFDYRPDGTFETWSADASDGSGFGYPDPGPARNNRTVVLPLLGASVSEDVIGHNQSALGSASPMARSGLLAFAAGYVGGPDEPIIVDPLHDGIPFGCSSQPSWGSLYLTRKEGDAWVNAGPLLRRLDWGDAPDVGGEPPEAQTNSGHCVMGSPVDGSMNDRFFLHSAQRAYLFERVRPDRVDTVSQDPEFIAQTFFIPYVQRVRWSLNQWGAERTYVPQDLAAPTSNDSGWGLDSWLWWWRNQPLPTQPQLPLPHPLLLSAFDAAYQPNPSWVDASDVDDDFSGDPRYGHAQYCLEGAILGPWLIARRLSEAGKFEAARRWLRSIYDPTATTPSVLPGLDQSDARKESWRTWRFGWFADRWYERAAAGTVAQSMDAVRIAMADPFDPHAVARAEPLAYLKAVQRQYLQTTISWADSLFTQYTRESLNEAVTLYFEALAIIGPPPVSVTTTHPGDAGAEVLTYGSIGEYLARLAVQPAVTGAGLCLMLPKVLASVSAFCPAYEDEFADVRDTLRDRLGKIRSGFDIDGIARSLALLAPPIDPALLVLAVANGVSPSAVEEASGESKRPTVRFGVAWQTATAFANEAKQLGQSLLSALEKADAEALASLRVQHEARLAALGLGTRELQVQEAQRNIDALRVSLASTRAREAGFRARVRVSPEERRQREHIAQASEYQANADAVNLMSSVLMVIGDLTVGMAAGATSGPGYMARAAGISGAVSGMQAQQEQHSATMLGMDSGWGRRAEDWDEAAEQAARDARGIEAQIAAAEARLAVARQELSTSQTQLAQSAAISDFMQRRFSGESLYRWMAGEVRRLHRDTLTLAALHARRARYAMLWELGLTDAAWVPSFSEVYVDAARDGVAAAERLVFHLNRLQGAYNEAQGRRLDIVKHVSLADIDPTALCRLRATGSCEFKLAPSVFNIDYPTHVDRRIHRVSISVPTLSGSLKSVPVTLELSGEDDVTDGVTRIATSSGANDFGVFEQNDARPMPFEGYEADDSTWTVRLPESFHTLDRDTVADVVLHLQYRAREGETSTAPALDTEKQNGWYEPETTPPAKSWTTGRIVLVSLRRDLPDAWTTLRTLASVPWPGGGLQINVPLALRLSHFGALGTAESSEKPVRVAVLALKEDDGTAPTLQVSTVTAVAEPVSIQWHEGGTYAGTVWKWPDVAVSPVDLLSPELRFTPSSETQLQYLQQVHDVVLAFRLAP